MKRFLPEAKAEQMREMVADTRQYGRKIAFSSADDEESFEHYSFAVL